MQGLSETGLLEVFFRLISAYKFYLPSQAILPSCNFALASGHSTRCLSGCGHYCCIPSLRPEVFPSTLRYRR